jgi:thioredoxin-related protein
MDVYTDWCGWCKRMDAVTFTNPVIAAYLNDNYYAVKLNAERKDTVIFHGTPFVNLYSKMPRGAHQIASFFLNGSLSYPSIVFLDENLNSIVLIQSYMEPIGLEPILSYLAHPQTVSWEEYQKTFVGKIKAVPPANAPADKSK